MSDYKHDIEKYLSGEMTPAEMNALEKKALSDPFLADALEGVQQITPGDFAADMNHLQQSLNAHVRKKNVGWVWIGRIAAGLLLLAVSAYLIVLVSNRPQEKSSQNLALNKQKELPTSPPAENSPLPAADSATLMDKGDQPTNRGQERARREQPTEPGKQKDQSGPLVQEEKPKPVAEEIEAREEKQQLLEEADVAETIESEREIAQAGPEESVPSSLKIETDKKKQAVLADDEAKAAASKSISGTVARSPSNSYNVSRKIIRGKVTFSEDGAPLPGVNVLVKGSNEGTVTNAQGNYEIAVEETQPTLLFSFIGFTNTEVIAKSEQLDVKLDADVSELSEVVVVGYGADGAPRSSAPAVMELATPEGGRRAFKQYLENNLQYPDQALKNEVEGKVTIQFSIGMTGQLSDFKIIRGIGYGCDEEVIRLIKAGPKWQPTKKNEEPIKDRVRVRMRFALPKK